MVSKNFKNRVGEKKLSSEGYSLEIVAYRSATDIDILVDGTNLVVGAEYVSFKRGSVRKPEARVGKVTYNTEGYLLEIVEYRGCEDIDVVVDGIYLLKHKKFNMFKTGKIPNPYHKSMCGVGYLGEGPHKASSNGEITEVYQMWRNMLRRCYDPKYHAVHPTYVVCEVVEQWHNFQVYADWYVINSYKVGSERMNVDKDLLCKGNKLYSPDLCVFVPQALNNLLLKHESLRGDLPMGVYKSGSKYRARHLCTFCTGRKVKDFGNFETPEEAFKYLKESKESYIKEKADYYKQLVAPEDQAKFKRVYDALYAYEVSIDD